MKLKDLEAIIKTKLNYKYVGPEEIHGRSWDYDGFDMSGYGNSNYRNMEILSRFAEYMIPFGVSKDNLRNPTFHSVKFWKGGGFIFSCSLGYNTELECTCVEEVTSAATCTIIRKIILLQNPQILKGVIDGNSRKT